MKRHDVRVGDILKLTRTPITIESGQNYTTIGIKSFGKRIFHYPPCDADELSKLRYFKFPAHALALSNIKAWEGAIALSGPGDLHAIASSRFLFYLPRDGSVDVRYLLYYFLSERGLAQIGQASPGSADRNRTLSITSFENLVVPLPEIDEQRRVASRLDMMLDRVEAVEFLRRQVAELQRNLGESAVNSALNSVTVRVRMEDVLELVREPVGIDPSSHYKALGVRSFGKGIIRYSDVIGSELSKLNYFTFPPNALTLSNIKAWEGAISVTSVEDASCVASNRFLFYLPRHDRVNVSYLRHYLLSKEGLAKISVASPGAADRNRTLGIKRFESIEFPLPLRPVQDKVARILDTLTDRLRRSYSSRILESMRPAILNAAFTGQL